MQQITTVIYRKYFCDNCGKEIDDKEHILIEDACRLGFVSPPEWNVPLSRRFRRTYQFCNVRCFSKFIREGKAK